VLLGGGAEVPAGVVEPQAVSSSTVASEVVITFMIGSLQQT